jgi:dnd system-associated protein 4
MVMPRRILRDVRRCQEFEDLYNKLGNREYKWPSGHRPDGAPVFGTIRDLLCFAAFLGFHLSRKESLEGHQTDVIPEEVFSKNEDALECIRLVALAEKKDQSIFEEDRVDEMVQIFEEYAHGGMKVIQRYVLDLPTDILGADAVVEGLRRDGLVNKREKDQSKGNLSGVRF